MENDNILGKQRASFECRSIATGQNDIGERHGVCVTLPTDYVEIIELADRPHGLGEFIIKMPNQRLLELMPHLLRHTAQHIPARVIDMLDEDSLFRLLSELAQVAQRKNASRVKDIFEEL